MKLGLLIYISIIIDIYVIIDDNVFTATHLTLTVFIIVDKLVKVGEAVNIIIIIIIINVIIIIATIHHSTYGGWEMFIQRLGEEA
jgi:hypothetical protein